ncbi:Hypothetical predicted protein, partial [Olea europaea subsp. europaea]
IQTNCKGTLIHDWNLVVRNPENRTLSLGNDIEALLRKAKESHKSCKNAATDALRNLGLDITTYNPLQWL